MPNLGTSTATSTLEAHPDFSVSPERFGASIAKSAVAAAGFALTITGGLLGSSASAGTFGAAVVGLSMTSNFQGSSSAAQIVGRAESKLAQYDIITPGVAGTAATLVLDFSAWNGAAVHWLFQGMGANFPIGTPNLAPTTPTYFTGWQGAPFNTTIYIFTYEDIGSGRSFSDTSSELANNGVGFIFTDGVDVVEEVLYLAQAASDGFVVDAPLWPGLREVSIACSGSAILRGTEKVLTLMDVGRDIYSLWGYTITDLRTISVGRASIVNCCNAAMQLIFSHADRLDYFNREQTTISVGTSGTAALPANVQRIQGPARIGAAPLRTLASRAEYDHFTALYVGDSTLAAPIAYYVEPTRASSGDSVGLSLNLAPVPTGTVSVVLDVTFEPPRYDIVDLMQATVLQLPHKWAETIFIPLVRKWCCADSMMPASRRASVMPQIDEQFAAAKQMLGLADIEPPAQSKAKPEKGGAPA